MRKIIQSSLLILILLAAGCSNENSNFKFVFMTDIHLQAPLEAQKGFNQALETAKKYNPDFIITGGDLIFDALGQNFDSAKVLYDMYSKIIHEYPKPIYNTIGNHEVFGLYEKSGVDLSHEFFGKEMYKKELGEGKTYYSFDHKGWHFISLDAIGFTEDRRYFGVIDSLQIEWLKNDLAKINTETPITVITHIPFVSVYGQIKYGSDYALNSGSAVTNSKDVLQLFDGYNLNLVLQGHLHIVEDIYYKDVHYITGGAVSAAWWKGPREGFEEGFVLVEVEGDNFDWKYIDYNWEPPLK